LRYTPGNRRHPGLAGQLKGYKEDGVLRGHDLPLPFAFWPCVGPDQATLCVLANLGLIYLAFGSIRDGDGVAAESDLDLAELAVAGQRLGIRGDSLVLAVAPARWGCPLEVVRNNGLKIRLKATG
jgi:hypothetical protein